MFVQRPHDGVLTAVRGDVLFELLLHDPHHLADEHSENPERDRPNTLENRARAAVHVRRVHVASWESKDSVNVEPTGEQ